MAMAAGAGWPDGVVLEVRVPSGSERVGHILREVVGGDREAELILAHELRPGFNLR